MRESGFLEADLALHELPGWRGNKSSEIDEVENQCWDWEKFGKPKKNASMFDTTRKMRPKSQKCFGGRKKTKLIYTKNIPI
jgi:hypothetical protein